MDDPTSVPLCLPPDNDAVGCAVLAYSYSEGSPVSCLRVFAHADTGFQILVFQPATFTR